MPPDTTDEFLEMITELEGRRKSQRLAEKKNQPACTHCFGEVIAAEGIPGQPGYRKRAPLRREGHHALQLADEIESRISLGKCGLSSQQNVAYNTWKTWRKDNSADSLLQKLDRDDGRDVTEPEMRKLINVLSTLLFPTSSEDDKMKVDFGWQDWSETPQRIATYYHADKGGPLISMCCFNQVGDEGYDNLGIVASGRIATILNGLVHAYLDCYACRCKGVLGSFEEDVEQLAGHGRAWQRIAGSIERWSPRILGYPLDIHRFESIVMNWYDWKHWPSRREVESWQLDYYATTEFDESDSDDEKDGEGEGGGESEEM
ncbi:uncharacterized protein J4E84_007953 [Alternaria hordeiaustralica]|uniref:uncharacterized protein n=1 Tax=Alternaria hordeiaustralica TaxID=1187925 RepID=UPI0020C58AEA|nr:uncharacterized protein J4E84_007953 [Alternaria hordeiaustralica]KAI4680305.1 hypothetical protein J4E84_007953 [Alternaria hordeiaustralica]